MLPPLQALEGGVKPPAFPKEGFAAFQGLRNPDAASAGSANGRRGAVIIHTPLAPMHPRWLQL